MMRLLATWIEAETSTLNLIGTAQMNSLRG